ncbi:KN motif and ankyrin repeat domain-containing protein 1 [Cloeon dipterum]|uniref:KN motif and ankyrin repeat domain-containing protein 1 n=1 Tax=Cloeon dipterum TaxID=197152 RepID=UPI00321F8C1C
MRMMVQCGGDVGLPTWTPPAPKEAQGKKMKQKCDCCPYGYHIDLDFVRFCEAVNTKASSAPSSKLRERRRQRQSMEVLLGITSPVVWQLEQQVECENTLAEELEERTVAEKLKDVVKEVNSSSSVLCRDALNKAVLDFEETLQLTNKKQEALPELPEENPVFASPPGLRVRRSPSTESLVSCSSDDVPLDNYHEVVTRKSLEYDTISIGSSVSGVSTGALQVVREQVAKSLEKMREMEENLKHIPILKSEVNVLKEEKRVMLLQMRAVEAERNKLAASLASMKPDPPHKPIKEIAKAQISKRDIGVDCAVLTRDVGVSHQYPKIRSSSTQADLAAPEVKTIVTPPAVPLRTSSRLSVERLKIESFTPEPVVTPEIKIPVQTRGTNTSAAFSKDSETSTELKMQQIYTERQLEEMLESHEKKIRRGEEALRAKLKVDKSVVAKPRMSDIGVTAEPKTKSVGVSDHTLKLTCDACNTPKKNVGVSTASLIPKPDYLNPQAMVRSKSSDHFNLRPKLRPMASKLTDTLGLICLQDSHTNTARVRTTDSSVHCKAATNDFGVSVMIEPAVTVKEVPAECKTCAARKSPPTIPRPESVSPLPAASLPSQIPRLASGRRFTSPPTKRPFNRQDTYTKLSVDISSETIPENGSESESTSPTSEVKLEGLTRNRVAVSSTSTEERSDDEGNQSYNPAAEPIYIISPQRVPRNKVEPSKEMRGAMKVMNDSLKRSPRSEVPSQLRAAVNIIQREWFKVSSTSTANPLDVEDYLDCFEDYSSELLEHIVNMTDDSGNTAMHYAVSNGNFDVVSILLDSKVCNVNQSNQAGYTSVMLVSLAEVKSETDAQVVQRLFQLSDVNVRAKQHGQTALMLAASHGKYSMASMLLAAGADVNIQDDDGSTALMCAAEHGHVDMVKLILSQTDIDAAITDHDGSTALNIAMEAGHRDVGVLLYAHQHFNSRSSSRTSSPYSTLKRKGK